MSIRQIKNASTTYLVSVLPLTASGTLALQSLIPPGVYKIRTHSSQSFTSAQLTLNSATSASTYGFTVTSGVSTDTTVAQACDEITITTGTFPLVLLVERQ